MRVVIVGVAARAFEWDDDDEVWFVNRAAVMYTPGGNDALGERLRGAEQGRGHDREPGGVLSPHATERNGRSGHGFLFRAYEPRAHRWRGRRVRHGREVGQVALSNSQLAQLRTRIQGDASDITDINSRIPVQLKQHLQDAEADIVLLKTRVLAAEADITQLKNRVLSLESRVTALGG